MYIALNSLQILGTLSNIHFLFSHVVNTCIFFTKECSSAGKRACYVCILLPFCLYFIAKLLLDTCFIPLHMNNLYIYQIYKLILSEKSDSHKTVQMYIYILEMPDFSIRIHYKLIFRTGISLLPLSNVAGVHGKEDCSAVHVRGASKTTQ